MTKMVARNRNRNLRPLPMSLLFHTIWGIFLLCAVPAHGQEIDNRPSGGTDNVAAQSNGTEADDKVSAAGAGDRRWWVTVDGKAHGPYAQAEIENHIRRGVILPGTRLRREGETRSVSAHHAFLFPDVGYPGYDALASIELTQTLVPQVLVHHFRRKYRYLSALHFAVGLGFTMSAALGTVTLIHDYGNLITTQQKLRAASALLMALRTGSMAAVGGIANSYALKAGGRPMPWNWFIAGVLVELAFEMVNIFKKGDWAETRNMEYTLLAGQLLLPNLIWIVYCIKAARTIRRHPPPVPKSLYAPGRAPAAKPPVVNPRPRAGLFPILDVKAGYGGMSFMVMY